MTLPSLTWRAEVEPPPAIVEVVDALRGVAAPWAIAGGWAIDLALGGRTRPHADVDVALFRDDQAVLREALAGWDMQIAIAGTLVPWPAGAWLSPPVHEVHARRGGDGLAVEFLLNERDGTDWVYRRDAAVRRPLSRAVRDTAVGVRVLAPEIVLLYKSKAPRPVDEHDLQVARPLLDAEARGWLRAAILRAMPGHPWADALAESGREL